MMMKYSASQFSADRKRLMEIVANKITYVGSDVSTFRVSFAEKEKAGLRQKKIIYAQ